MIIYLLIFIFILVLCIVSNRKNSIFICLLLGVFLILFSGLRGNIDGDIEAYYNKYSLYQSDDISIEYSFILLSGFVDNTVKHFNFLLIIYVSISISILTYVIITIGNSNVYIFLYFYSYYFFILPMTQIRAAIGTVILLLSIKMIYEKKTWKYLICIITAYFFHISSLAFLPFYWILNYFNLTLKKCILILFAAITMSQFFPLLEIISNALPSDSGIPILLKMVDYSNNIGNGIGVKTAKIYFWVAILKLTFNIIFRVIYKDSLEFNKYFKICLDLHFWAYITYIVFSDMNVVGARLAELFGFVEILLIPQMIVWSKESLFVKSFVVLLCLFQLIIVLYVFELFKPYDLIY